MQIRTDGGWIKAGLAVLVAGSLAGGVVAATGIGVPGPKRVIADGMTDKALPPGPSADAGFDLAAAVPLEDQEGAKPDLVVGDKIKVGSDGGSVTVSAVEDDLSAGRLFGAGEGLKYIAIEVKGCAGPNEKNLTFQPSYFLLRLDDGTVHDPGPGVKKPSLEGGKMTPGKCLSGWVTYTVKEGSLATAVIYDGSSRLTWTVPLPKGAKPTRKAGVATGASSTTSTTVSKVKVSSTTTTAKRKAASGSTSNTSKTTGTKASSTTTTKPVSTTSTSGFRASSTSTSGPAKSSTSTTTTRPTVVTAPAGQEE